MEADQLTFLARNNFICFQGVGTVRLKSSNTGGNKLEKERMNGMGEFYLGGKTCDWSCTGIRLWFKGGGVKPPVKDPQNAKTSCFAAESCQKM